jgi:hypothetical protein
VADTVFFFATQVWLTTKVTDFSFLDTMVTGSFFLFNEDGQLEPSTCVRCPSFLSSQLVGP